MAEPKTSEARRRSNAKYDAKNTIQFKMKLNINQDADIIRKLSEVGNKQGYIKRLIRKDISS